MSSDMRSVMVDLTLPSILPPKVGEVTSETTIVAAMVDVAVADLDMVTTRVAVAAGALVTLKPVSTAKCMAKNTEERLQCHQFIWC